MIIDYEYYNQKLTCSYVDDTGKIQMMNISWQEPFDWVECGENDPNKDPLLHTWEGTPVKKQPVKRRPNKHSVAYFLESLEPGIKDKIFGFRKPNAFFIDIETEIKDEFESPKTARNEVQSIAIVNKDKCLVLATKKLNEAEQKWVTKETNDYFKDFEHGFNIKYMFFDKEYDMMYYFINTLVPVMPVITGWNFVSYDWQYMMNRCQKHLNIDIRATSFTRRMDRFEEQYIMPKHRVVCDYMELTKKWGSHLVKDSAKLDFVSKKALGVKKVNYTGDLKQLYLEDYPKFILYNIVDTILVYFLDKRNKYLDIMLAISDLTKVRMIDSLGTVGPTEGMLRIPLLKEQNIVFVKQWGRDKFDVEGGYVRNPKPGMKKHLAIFDFASLYPTIIREFNITPEAYVGIYDKKTNTVSFKGRTVNYDPKIHTLTEFNTVFSKEASTTQRRFSEVYADRQKYKALMKKAIKEKTKLEEELKEIELELGLIN